MNPADQLPDSVAGSTIRITRSGGSWGALRRLTALRRVLLVVAAVSSCAGAALATCGIWQLASTVQDVIQLAAPVGVAGTPAEPTGDVPARTPSITPGFPEPAPVPPTEETPGAGSRAGHGAAEASENPAPIGAHAWPEYVRTECSGVFVYIVTTSVDSPRDSAASLGLTKNGRARFRRAGQMLGEWEVLAITEDWSGLNPGVWLIKDRQFCRAELAGNPSRVHVALKPPPKKKPPRKRRPRGRRR